LFDFLIVLAKKISGEDNFIYQMMVLFLKHLFTSKFTG